MSIRNYNAWIKAARRAAKRTAGLAAPAKRKALEVAQRRVARAQAGVGKANERLAKAKLSEARAQLRATARDLRAIERAGNVSMADARKAYRKMSARLGRALKGTDVKNHPRILKESLAPQKRDQPAAKAVRGKVPKAAPGGRKKESVIRSVADFLAAELTAETVEFASTAEYKKGG